MIDPPQSEGGGCRINPDGVGALRAYLDRFWKRSLMAFKRAVEKGEELS